MRQQFLALEGRTTRGGRDSIDHPPDPNNHDDIASSVAGSCLIALEHGALMPAYRLPAHAIGSAHDPLASDRDNQILQAREETRSRGGHFSGPGRAPTWHGRDDEQQQSHAIN